VFLAEGNDCSVCHNDELRWDWSVDDDSN
jgi:hypothetical protein